MIYFDKELIFVVEEKPDKNLQYFIEYENLLHFKESHKEVMYYLYKFLRKGFKEGAVRKILLSEYSRFMFYKTLADMYSNNYYIVNLSIPKDNPKFVRKPQISVGKKVKTPEKPPDAIQLSLF